MSNLKLEVGKRYETRDGSRAFVSLDTGDYILGVIQGSKGMNIWTKDGCVWRGIQNHHLDLIRCLDDEPELVDLTKIDVPFGALDERTQDRLVGAVARGAALVFRSRPTGPWLNLDGIQKWVPALCYRLKPEEPTYTMPTVDPKVWAALPGAKAIAWDDGVGSMYAYTEVPRRGSSAWGRCDGQMSRIHAELFGDLIQRGDCPWDQAIVLRPEGV